MFELKSMIQLIFGMYEVLNDLVLFTFNLLLIFIEITLEGGQISWGGRHLCYQQKQKFCQQTQYKD